jgi:hypothetical protein
MQALLAILSVAVFISTHPMHAQTQNQNQTGPVIVIKADDLLYHPNQNVFGEGWNRFLEIAHKKRIKTSIGIICKSLDQDAPEYFKRIRDLNDSGQVEFWNHGYNHARNKEANTSEFEGPDTETQLATLSLSQRLAKEKLGFTFQSFGAPFNANDAHTPKALSQIPELTNWMHGVQDTELLAHQFVLNRGINLEQPVHHPNFEAFKAAFLKNPDRPYYVLQGHPGGWDEARFEQFTQIIDFLQNRHAVFMTPSELRSHLLQDK